MLPIHARFVDSESATHYTAKAIARYTDVFYRFRLVAPKDDPNCKDLEVDPDPAVDEAVWHHSNSDGCQHTGTDHAGVVVARAVADGFVCTAGYAGSKSGDGLIPDTCKLVCPDQLAAYEVARAKFEALKELVADLERAQLGPAQRDFQAAGERLSKALAENFYLSDATQKAIGDWHEAIGRLQQLRETLSHLRSQVLPKSGLNEARDALQKCTEKHIAFSSLRMRTTAAVATECGAYASWRKATVAYRTAIASLTRKTHPLVNLQRRIDAEVRRQTATAHNARARAGLPALRSAANRLRRLASTAKRVDGRLAQAERYVAAAAKPVGGCP
jgi:hypothetical protein